MNTVEHLPFMTVCGPICGLYHTWWAIGLMTFAAIARIVYAVGYYKNANERGLGALMSFLCYLGVISLALYTSIYLCLDSISRAYQLGII